jgi:hypothetical protein
MKHKKVGLDMKRLDQNIELLGKRFKKALDKLEKM